MIMQKKNGMAIFARARSRSVLKRFDVKEIRRKDGDMGVVLLSA